MSKAAVVIRHGEKPKKGGALSRVADDVRKAGRYGDDMLVHITKDEFEQLKQAYGEPTLNPDTGLPEFFLGSLVSALLPAAVTTLTGAGSAVGSVIGSAAPALSSGVTNFLGNALVGAGIGALTNTKDRGRGALIGALGGGFAPMAAGALGLEGAGTNAALGNLLGGLGIGRAQAGPAGFPSGSALRAANDLPAAASAARGMTSQAVGGAARAAQAGQGGGILQTALPLMLAAGALGGGGRGQSAQSAPPPEYTAEQRRIAADNARPLEQVSNVRFRVAGAPQQVTPRYGIEGGEREFYEDNRLPATSRAASGGYVTRQGVLSRMMASGGEVEDGRSDRVPALLSPGEYVIDAESVSMLGNGSSEAGAAMLDRLRQQIRKHKAQRMREGEMSAPARTPMRYMEGR